MIRTFADDEVEGIWRGERSRRLPPDIQQTARRKLRQLDSIDRPDQLNVPRGNRFEELKGDRKGTYSLRVNDQWRITSPGRMEARRVSGSRTIISDDDRLANVHPGDILREDFLIGGDIALDEVVAATGLGRDRLVNLIEGTAAVDADADVRLARYFGMSEGFFLRLQNAHDLDEAHRTHGAEFDRIALRAA